jgi:mono/diheme cytochrome c family protein
LSQRRAHPLSASLLLVLFLSAGCHSSSEEADYAFPSRTDALVLRLPTQAPEKPTQPGQWETELATLTAQGGQVLSPLQLPLEQRTAIDTALRELFGTPSRPRLVSNSVIGERLGLTEERLQQGGQLYRRHRCLQCHNVTGDGRGPAGQWVTPYPRDFRQGVFKFTTSGSSKPRRRDLHRTLREGLKGTAMPSFALLAESDRDLLASYVTYLAIRGQVEFEALVAVAQGSVPEMGSWLAQQTEVVLRQWQAAEEAPAVPVPPDDGPPGSPRHQEAVQRGFALFTAGGENSCQSCHGDFGRRAQLRYEIWGTTARAANLTEHPLKSQPQAEDLYARIRWGIAAVGMPAHPEYTDRQVWDLVRLVQSMPFPRELPPPVRAAVYPDSGGQP